MQVCGRQAHDLPSRGHAVRVLLDVALPLLRRSAVVIALVLHEDAVVRESQFGEADGPAVHAEHVDVEERLG